MNNGEFLINVGKKIREVRKSKGISMRQLVIMAPMHKSSLSELENGKMNYHLLALKKVADALGVEVKDFLW